MVETNLNLSLLSELSEIMGDEMGMLIESYFEDSRLKIADLLNKDLGTQQEQIYKLAHSLKGSSRNVGVVEFSDYCEKIEKLARGGRLTRKDISTERLNTLFEGAEKALRERYL